MVRALRHRAAAPPWARERSVRELSQALASAPALPACAASLQAPRTVRAPRHCVVSILAPPARESDRHRHSDQCRSHQPLALPRCHQPPARPARTRALRTTAQPPSRPPAAQPPVGRRGRARRSRLAPRRRSTPQCKQAGRPSRRGSRRCTLGRRPLGVPPAAVLRPLGAHTPHGRLQEPPKRRCHPNDHAEHRQTQRPVRSDAERRRATAALVSCSRCATSSVPVQRAGTATRRRRCLPVRDLDWHR